MAIVRGLLCVVFFPEAMLFCAQNTPLILTHNLTSLSLKINVNLLDQRN